jgi:hypothetical protein
VDSYTIIVYGSLANKTQFLGDNIAETISIANVDTGAWNGDQTHSIDSVLPWFLLGSNAGRGSDAGAFTFSRGGGDVRNDFSHRTILSGY